MAHRNTPMIIKANGQRVRFSVNKLIRSLTRSGAPRELAKRIAHDIAADVKDGMSTKDIYTRAKKQLTQKKQSHTAARYSLKQAIHDLGPTGFPFEVFISRVLEAHGYSTTVSVIMQGKCVTHEIDVVAQKNDTTALIEAKFHNQPGAVTDVKVPLYIQSRFQDVVAGLQGDKRGYVPWIVTNTKFSQDATSYGECMGMSLLGWRYPQTGGLEYVIESSGLQPITCLSQLTKAQKTYLLKNDIVLCKEIFAQKKHVEALNLSSSKRAALQKEIQSLCHA